MDSIWVVLSNTFTISCVITKHQVSFRDSAILYFRENSLLMIDYKHRQWAFAFGQLLSLISRSRNWNAIRSWRYFIIKRWNLLFQIGCRGDNASQTLCGEARPELLTFNCSVVQQVFQSYVSNSYAGFQLQYHISHTPFTGMHNTGSLQIMIHEHIQDISSTYV